MAFSKESTPPKAASEPKLPKQDEEDAEDGDAPLKFSPEEEAVSIRETAALRFPELSRC